MRTALGFEELFARLLFHLEQRVRRGEISERGLARLTRYSQPHIHNVLKGTRKLTAELADRILRLFGIPLLALLSQEELGGLAPPAMADFLPVPVLQGRLGAGHPFPQVSAEASGYFLPTRLLAAASSPVVAVVDRRETTMSPLLEPGDWILLDRAPAVRRRPQFESAYALSWKGKGLLGRCRLVGNGLVLVTDNPRPSIEIPHTIPLAGRDILDVVKGKIVWVSRELSSMGEI